MASPGHTFWTKSAHSVFHEFIHLNIDSSVWVILWEGSGALLLAEGSRHRLRMGLHWLQPPNPSPMCRTRPLVPVCTLHFPN
jgi:hypothetical protein